MALPTAPWRFEREDIGILPTAFPVDKNPTFSYTTTKVNGDVLAGDAWVITQTSPFTTLPAASLDEVSSSSLGTHIMTSSQTLTQADVLESSTACQNAIGRSSTTSLPSVMAEAFTSGTKQLSVPPRNASATDVGALVATPSGASTSPPPYALTLDLGAGLLTMPEQQLATGIPVLLKVDPAGHTTRYPARPLWTPSSMNSTLRADGTSARVPGRTSRGFPTSSPTVPKPAFFSGHAGARSTSMSLLLLYLFISIIFVI